MAHADPSMYITKPFGYAYFAWDVLPAPRAWVATTGNLVWHRQHAEGGHFAALERPEVLLQDVEDFVKELRKVRVPLGVVMLHSDDSSVLGPYWMTGFEEAISET